MPPGASHLHRAGHRLKGRALERLGDLLRRRDLALFNLGVFRCVLEAENGLGHFARRVSWRGAVSGLVLVLEPAIEFVIRRERTKRATAAYDHAVGSLVLVAVQGGLAAGQNRGGVFQQTTGIGLQHKRFHVAAPEAGVDDVRALDRQSGNLGAVLTLEDLGHLRLDHLGLGHQLLHGVGEVFPAVLSKGVVLLDAGNFLRVRADLGQVTGGADIVHGRIKAGAEDKLRGLVFVEQLRSAAIVKHGHGPQLFGHRRNGQAVAGGNVAHHCIDLLALHQVTELFDLFSRAARFVDDHHLDFGTVDTNGVVRRRELALV
ncbi:hypothetical protein D3C81_987560 [compost metagenome]